MGVDDALARGLKVERARHGWSQQDLADHSGVSLGVIGNIESCRTPPKLATALELAKALGVSIDSLILQAQ